MAIGGASGLLGTLLTEALTRRGDQVIRLVRRQEKLPDERQWNPDAGIISGPGLDDVDAVVNLAGAPIAGHRWTPKYKSEIVRSRIASTQTIVRALQVSHYEEFEDATTGTHASRFAGQCKVFLSANAVGYYGYDNGNALLPESAPPGTGFLANVCEEWQGAASPAANLGVQVAFLRTANVLDNHGGMMKLLRPLYLLGLGGRIGTGYQWVPWITSEDHVRAMLFLLDNPVNAPVNLCAPQPVRNKEFVDAYAHSLGRPARIPFPAPLVSRILTPQMVQETLLASQRAVPDALTELGFQFNQPTYEDALQWLQDNQSQAGQQQADH